MEKDFKKGADFTFESNPDLARIGTKEQYEKYLETVFPDSKVKDIVYHRGPQKIENFDKSKIKDANAKRFYFSPINTRRYGQHITQALLNIKNLAVPSDDNFIDDVNKKHPEYTKGKSKWFHLPSQIYKNADKYGYDGVSEFVGTNDEEYSVYNRSQIHILGSKKDKKDFYKFVHRKNKPKTLEKIVSSIFIFSFLAGLFLSSSLVTGNIISTSPESRSLMGIILTVLGITGLVIYKKLK